MGWWVSEIVSLLLIGVSQIECGLFRPRRRVSPVRTGWLVGRLALAVGCASEGTWNVLETGKRMVSLYRPGRLGAAQAARATGAGLYRPHQWYS